MQKDYEYLKLKNQLCFPLYASSRKIVNAYTPLLKPLGLTYTQYLVFLVLWEKENITVGDLCRELFLDAGTITPLLKKLESNGYINRTRSKSDERVTFISLTQKGTALKEQCKDIPLKIAPILCGLDPGDVFELYRILYEFLENKNPSASSRDSNP